MMKRLPILAVCALVMCAVARGDNGSRLWLRQQTERQAVITVPQSGSETVGIAADELRQGWTGTPVVMRIDPGAACGDEGFAIEGSAEEVRLTACTDIGLLYGAYHLLRLQACGTDFAALRTVEQPVLPLRILNHWDNLDGTVERGYAGRSIWRWEKLPEGDCGRYIMYARANASLGINGTVLNNVNASAQILSAEYLAKVKRLADLFRPYGIRVYLSVNFASPMLLGGLGTADPRSRAVRRWWREKADEIYAQIPDFGGFLVKANSEGQPGPCDYGRTHAEGADMLADILKPHGGRVIWRAFVYNPDDDDRAKQAYDEFKPLDGKFRGNVLLQVKNGPVDFQPREPYSPLFGAMRRTKSVAEVQITQEYLGHANHLVYLAPMWEEFFGQVDAASLAGAAGVANTGDSIDWCGHPFAQANWYAFGRMAWNPAACSGTIADEWLKQTFGTDEEFVATARAMMLASREAAVDYMMPLGLHHIFAWGHHYGPEPWCEVEGARADWLPSYYHRADSEGVGFDRTTSGSDAVSQYPEPLRSLYNDPNSCPEEYLLWFHHVPWERTMRSGRTLWEELCTHYERGCRAVEQMRRQWDSLEKHVDAERFDIVRRKLAMQADDARWWKDACLLYFQDFSGKEFPENVAPPQYKLEEMKDFQLKISNFECAPHGFVGGVAVEETIH